MPLFWQSKKRVDIGGCCSLLPIENNQKMLARSNGNLF
jgi:hypothetical protein